MRVVSRTVERHRDTTFDKERHAAIAPLVRDDAEGTRRADEEPSGAVAPVGRGRGPRRRQEAALAVAREPHRRLRRVELPVPKLARDLLVALVEPLAVVRELAADRKSTRLNSSHGYISYAVFCLKKKIRWFSNHR